MISVRRDFLLVPYCVEEWPQDALENGISLEQLSIEMVFDTMAALMSSYLGAPVSLLKSSYDVALLKTSLKYLTNNTPWTFLMIRSYLSLSCMGTLLLQL